MKTKLISITLGLFFATAIASCVKPKAVSEEGDEEVVYEASTLRKASVASQLTLPGELEGYYETEIVAKVNGYIKTMMVDIGDRVREGQTLVQLEAPELISQQATAYSEYQAKEALFVNTKGKYVRFMQTNRTPGAVSPYDMDLAKTTLTADSLGYLAAKAKYESIRELTAYLKIVAPFDGVITERALAPGAFVGPGEKHGVPMLKLKKESTLRLHIAVPEKHLAEVSLGEIVRFHVKSFPDEFFSGKITRLSRNLSLMTRSETVEIEIDNRDGKLLPGMYAIASLPIRRPGESFVIPKSAVVTNMENQFVIKIKNGREVAYVPVEKGEDQNDRVEVFGQLTPGDTLLRVASDEIKDRSNVKIVVVSDDVAIKK